MLPTEHQLKDLLLVVVVIAASARHHPKHHRARGPPDRLQGRRRVHAQPELAAEAREVFDARPQPGHAPARRRVPGVDEQHAVEVEEQGHAPHRAGRKVPRGAAGGDPALRGSSGGAGGPGAAAGVGVGSGVGGGGGSAAAASVVKGIGFVVPIVDSSLHGARTRLSLLQSLHVRVIDAQARRGARRRSIRRAVGRSRSSIHIGVVVGISPMLPLRRLPLERDDVAQGDDGCLFL